MKHNSLLCFQLGTLQISNGDECCQNLYIIALPILHDELHPVYFVHCRQEEEENSAVVDGVWCCNPDTCSDILDYWRIGG